MKEKKVCPHCGRLMIEYRFGLNKGLLAFLKELARVGKPVTLEKLVLTKGQYTNHALVRHWGLAEMMAPENELEQRKGGKWRLTSDGLAFLRGQHSVQKYVFTVLGKKTREEGPRIRVSAIDEGYLYHGDYADQAREQIVRSNSQMNLI